MWQRKATAALLTCCLLLAGISAEAQVAQSDLQVTGRALSFLVKPLTGEVIVGVIYVPGNPRSVREAESLQRILGAGLKVGNVTFKPLLVAATDVARVNVDMFFLIPGLGTEAKALADATRAKRVPCVTTDIAQVTDGVCTMGIRSQPKVEILVNRAAAAGSNTEFSSVFRMMITEI